MSKRIILHPFFIALIPVLFIAAHNLAEAPGKDIVFSSLIGLGVTAGLLAVLRLFIASWETCAVVCSLFLITLFSYGPLFDLIYSPKIPALGFSLGLAGVLLVGFIFFASRIIKHPKSIAVLNKFMNLFSLIMLGMISFSLVTQPIFISKAQKIPGFITARLQPKAPQANAEVSAPSTVTKKQANSYPDIYYIILDGYARGDVLKHLFNHDNSYFETALKDRGFYVADQSTSNYPATWLSICSSLNMEHIDQLAAVHGMKNFQPYYEKIQQPKLVKTLKEHGYQYVTIAGGWDPTGHSPYSDMFLSTKISTLSAYQRTILAMTPLKLWMGRSDADVRLFALDKLKTMPALAAHPKFVFLHLVMPHPPYYFDSHGKIINTTQTDENPEFNGPQYIDQIKFLNGKVITAVKSIIENSTQQPIVIIQADHGSHATFENQLQVGTPSPLQVYERFSILNAYYGPKELLAKVYPTITPVNSFRLVLNYLQMGEYPLLPDKNYFIWYEGGTGIQDVTHQVLATRQSIPHLPPSSAL